MNKKFLSNFSLSVAMLSLFASITACGVNQPKYEKIVQDSSESVEEKSTDGTSTDVYILPQKLENPDLVIVWDCSEETWNQMKEADDNAFNLVWTTKEAFEKMYGGTVTVIAVEWGEMMNQTISMVDNGEICDLVQANDQNFPKYAVGGYVQDVSKYVDLSDDFWYSNVTQAFTFGGIPYAMGDDANPVVISYNKTLFEEKGVKTPREYFEENNWNWDTFKEVAMKMTEDKDGDGTPEVYGFGWWDSFWVQMLATNGTTGLVYDKDGSIKTNFLSDEAQQTFEFIENAYVKDKFIKKTDGDSFINDFKTGKLVMTCEYGFAAKTAYESEYEIDWAPLPSGPSAEEYSCGGSVNGFAIPSTSKNPEGAAAFARMAYELQIDYNRRQRVEKFGLQDVDLMNELAKYIKFSPIGVANYWDTQSVIADGLINGKSIDEFSKKADKLIQDGNK